MDSGVGRSRGENLPDAFCHAVFLSLSLSWHAQHSFFLVDDDIRMTASSVNRLFDVMKDYNLEIAQPALTLSYGTYYITMHDPTCMLRYTDFVEMMMPCFSRDALLKVLPTFKEKVRWQGIEFHWPVLIDTCHKDMAVIDDILAVHARSIRSNSPVYCKLMDKYMKENHLSMNENVYGCVPRSEDTLQHDGYVVTVQWPCAMFRM